VITRALGIEDDVKVDTERIAARAGDLFLLCSDGLTSMVRDTGLVPVLEGASSLEEAGRNLIAAANAAGGRDNITVVLFRLEDIDTSGMIGDAQVTAEGDAVADERGATRDADAVPVAAITATDEQERAYQEDHATRTHEVPEAAPEPEPARQPPSAPPPAAIRRPEPAPRKKRRFPVKGLIATLVVLAIVLAGGFVATRAVYFVDEGDRGFVAIYQGVPYELPLGVELYREVYESSASLDAIPSSRRDAFTERRWRSRNDAFDLVRQAERGKLRE
jgi:protein phosphatase